MTAVEPVAWRYRQDSWDDLWRLSTAQPVYQYTKIEPLYSQATVDTLRAQLEAAEAGNHRRSDSQPTWAELTQYWKARAEAAEAELSGIRRLVEIVGQTESRAVGAAAMYLAARASECNAGEIKTTMHGLTSAGKPIGDWDVTVQRSARTKEETK